LPNKATCAQGDWIEVNDQRSQSKPFTWKLALTKEHPLTLKATRSDGLVVNYKYDSPADRWFGTILVPVIHKGRATTYDERHATLEVEDKQTCSVLATDRSAMLTPAITRRVVNSSIPHSDRGELLNVTTALIVAAIAATLFEIARSVIVLRLRGKVSISLQAALWDRLLALPVSFFRRFAVGDLGLRSMGIDQLQRLLTNDVISAGFSFLTALFSLAVMFYYSPRLALAGAATTLVLIISIILMVRHQLHHVRSWQYLDGKLSSLVYAMLSGIAKLRIAGAEKRAFARWTGLFQTQRSHSMAVQRMSYLQTLLGTAYAVGTSILVFAMISTRPRLGMNVGDFLAFNAAFMQFQAAALGVVTILPSLLSFWPTYERMQPILEANPESQEHQPGLNPLRGEIELRNVSFRYEDGPLVLENVSLRAKPGEFVALVGLSGSGKSTCLRLMLGFERPQAGAVLIDGVDIQSLNMQSVRRSIGVVLQNGRPLVGDIFHNIIGSLPLTLEDAWRAARMVGLEDEIRKMPMSMFTFVNQRGVSFSGGQRQRMLLARAVVKNPRMLFLDEATSALDNRTQELITRNLAEIGPTRIVIAHRLSTVRDADRICVLHQGRIAEEGTFDDLILSGGVFSRMAKQQLLYV
jgi:NHLM bacteriocin system ABC transporter ATP-binding protein